MKIIELKENEPLKLEEAYYTYEFKGFPNPNTGELVSESKRKIEEKRVYMKVFTDGEIIKVDDEETKPIREYYINGAKYDYYVDTLKTKNLYLKDYSYVITYLIAQEHTRVGNLGGFFDIVQDVTVYLENKKDKEAIKKARKVIQCIEDHNRRVDTSSLWGFLFSGYVDEIKYDFEKVSDNVYTLKK